MAKENQCVLGKDSDKGKKLVPIGAYSFHIGNDRQDYVLDHLGA